MNNKIPHGDETDNEPWYIAPDADSPCHDCGADPGEGHESGCDVEQCPTCNQQRIACNC